jgi:hypothetical protein
MNQFHSLSYRVRKFLYGDRFQVSPDEVAIKGRDEYLFLFKGFNRYYQMYFDQYNTVQTSVDKWVANLSTWEKSVSAKNSQFFFVVVPNKSTYFIDKYPLPLPKSGTPYLESLSKNTDCKVFWPENKNDVFRRNDTHLSPHGNFKFAEFIVDSLGYSFDFDELVSTGFQELIGDLGSKFEPQVSERVEFFKSTNSSAIPNIVLDTSTEYLPDRHIGITIQLENPDAPIERSLRIFGNSFLGNSSENSTLWLLGLVFEKVIFHWSPIVLPETLGTGEIVIFQTCERFLGYSPDHWK